MKKAVCELFIDRRHIHNNSMMDSDHSALTRSSLLAGASQIVNLLFPILTTPLLAYLLDSPQFGRLALAATLSYFQTTIVDAGIGSFLSIRWSRSKTSKRSIGKLIPTVLFLQLAAGMALSPVIFFIGIYWLNLDILLVFIAFLAGFTPILLPTWISIVTRQGHAVFIATIAGRTASVVLIIITGWLAPNDALLVTLAISWLLIPSVIPAIFFWPLMQHGLIKPPTHSKRIAKIILSQIRYGLIGKLSVAVYGSLPSMMIGRYLSADFVGSYLFIDRLRVLSQTVISSQYPVVTSIPFFRRHLNTKNVFFWSLIIGIAFYAGFVFILPHIIREIGLESRLQPTIFAMPLIGVIGGLVIISNTLIQLLLLPKFGQKFTSHILLVSAALSSIVVPACFFFGGAEGAIGGALLIEAFILINICFRLFR